MNKRKLEEFSPMKGIKINSCSTILNIYRDEYDLKYKVEYYESPFDDELDVYDVEELNFSEYEYFDDVKGYVFYGKQWDSQMKKYYMFFAKQVDRIKNKTN